MSPSYHLKSTEPSEIEKDHVCHQAVAADVSKKDNLEDIDIDIDIEHQAHETSIMKQVFLVPGGNLPNSMHFVEFKMKQDVSHEKFKKTTNGMRWDT